DQISAPRGNPYDFAATVEGYLRSAKFQYEADVRDLRTAQCAAMSSVECFATIKKGYCEYYASLMTMLLRQNGIPARIAYGFLGPAHAADGVVVVPASAAHWWVEAYFANYGWIEFDPTGTQGRPTTLPPGGIETPRPAGTFNTGDRGEDAGEPTPRL